MCIHQTDTRDQQYVQLVRLLAIYEQECELIDCLHAACGPDCDAVAMATRPRRSTDTSTSRAIAAVVMDTTLKAVSCEEACVQKKAN